MLRVHVFFSTKQLHTIIILKKKKNINTKAYYYTIMYYYDLTELPLWYLIECINM